MHPSDETLADLALGDAVPQQVQDHVHSCPACQALVDELRGLAAELRDAAPLELDVPPDHVWTAIQAATGPAAEPTTLPDSTRERPSDQPPLGEPAGQQPQTVAAAEPAQKPRRFGRRWLLGGIAAGVAIGVVGATVLQNVVEPKPLVVAQASLDTLDTRQPGGRATVTNTSSVLELNLQVQPLTAAPGYLEVWLINTDLKRMVSVGVLPNGASQQQFPITASLLVQGYTIVDISREPFDDRPQHSGDSLLRGALS